MLTDLFRGSWPRWLWLPDGFRGEGFSVRSHQCLPFQGFSSEEGKRFFCCPPAAVQQRSEVRGAQYKLGFREGKATARLFKHHVWTQQMPPLSPDRSAELSLLQARAVPMLLPAPLASRLLSCPPAALQALQAGACTRPAAAAPPLRCLRHREERCGFRNNTRHNLKIKPLQIISSFLFLPGPEFRTWLFLHRNGCSLQSSSSRRFVGLCSRLQVLLTRP